MAKTAARIRERDDGFYEVSGVGGYHKREDAIRIARQVAQAQEIAEKTGVPYREAAPGQVFTDGEDVSVDKKPEKQPEK